MPRPPLTDAERRARIAARREGSLFWQAIEAGASLKLAMSLLLTIALACAIATVAESKFNTDVARHYIYKAPWFTLWLGVLVCNLLCVTISRWPWQRKHMSFIVAHYGIILLLAGAVVGSRWGYEGFLNLEVGQPPQGRVVLNQTVLDIASPVTGALYETPFPVDFHPPTEARPRLLPVPESVLQLRVDRHAENLLVEEHLVPATAADAGPGIELKFASRMMGQEVPITLLARDPARRERDFFGLAAIEWADSFAATTQRKVPTLRVRREPGGHVAYQLLRAGEPYAKGLLQPGVSVAVGWADWQVTLVAALPQAAVSATLVEGPANAPDGTPGLRAELLDGGKVVDGPRWILSGRRQAFRTPEGRPLDVAFGMKTRPLPFALTLLKFEVPRDEGTETPSDFIATVRFEDAAGRAKVAEAHMNYPASFPGGFWGSVFGRNYKFSQTSWNPQDLDQTTLQVLYDPGWPMKWLGSILIVAGVALLFYYKPRVRPTNMDPVPTEPAVPSSR
jgi:hypothetical protein